MERCNEVVILCGGRGTRLFSSTSHIPKSLLEVGDMPILEHIIRNYSYHGFSTVKLLLGYQGEKIRNYFKIKKLKDLNIEFIDTGLDTDTNERIWQIRNDVSSCFALCYSDILANVNFSEQYLQHKKQSKILNILTVPLRTNYGIISFNENYIATNFQEKPTLPNYWINGGYFFVESEIFDHWNNDHIDFSRSVLPALCKQQKASCYIHDGFWQGIDTEKDLKQLNELWASGNAPWVMWK